MPASSRMKIGKTSANSTSDWPRRPSCARPRRRSRSADRLVNMGGSLDVGAVGVTGTARGRIESGSTADMTDLAGGIAVRRSWYSQVPNPAVFVAPVTGAAGSRPIRSGGDARRPRRQSRYPSGCARRHAQADPIISRASIGAAASRGCPARGRSRRPARAGRRPGAGPIVCGIGLPTTASAAPSTSRTENPVDVPRLQTSGDVLGLAPSPRGAARWASARSATWM